MQKLKEYCIYIFFIKRKLELNDYQEKKFELFLRIEKKGLEKKKAQYKNGIMRVKEANSTYESWREGSYTDIESTIKSRCMMKGKRNYIEHTNIFLLKLYFFSFLNKKQD